MLTNLVIFDVVFVALLSGWLVLINRIGNTDQKGGAGFVAFMLSSLVAITNVVVIVAAVVSGVLTNF